MTDHGRFPQRCSMLSGVAVFLAMHILALAQIEVAQAALDAGRVGEAQVMLEARLSDPEAMALLSRVYLQQRLVPQARESALRAEGRGAHLPGVQHQLALYYAQSGQRLLAAKWEGRFAESPAADSAAALRAALLFAEARQWPEVLRFGRLALAKGDRPEVRRLLAQACEATGDQAGAIIHQRVLADQLPYDEDTQAELGKLLLRCARFNDAATALESAQRKFDKSPQIELSLGVAYYSQRRFGDAGGRFLRVVELDPAIPQPYIFLAKMLDQLPERANEIRSRAEAWYRSEPRNGFAPFVYARALQATGSPDEVSKPLLVEAMRRNPRHWEFPFELGQLLERQRDFAGAARAYEASLAVNEQLPETHYRLARLYERLGDPAKAERERSRHKQLLGKPKAGMQ